MNKDNKKQVNWDICMLVSIINNEKAILEKYPTNKELEIGLSLLNTAKYHLLKGASRERG